MGCASASGQALPICVTFDTATLNVAWTEGEVPGTTYGLSKKGWIDTVILANENQFVKHAVPARPLLLLLDGHSSHFQPEVLRYAQKSKMIVFCLPPHTTQASQPLDARSCVWATEATLGNVCHKYMQKNPGKGILNTNF